MLNESSEKAHQLVALGLLARVFYASEPLGTFFIFEEMSKYSLQFSRKRPAFVTKVWLSLRLSFVWCAKSRHPRVEKWGRTKGLRAK